MQRAALKVTNRHNVSIAVIRSTYVGNLKEDANFSLNWKYPRPC